MSQHHRHQIYNESCTMYVIGGRTDSGEEWLVYRSHGSSTIGSFVRDNNTIGRSWLFVPAFGCYPEVTKVFLTPLELSELSTLLYTFNGGSADMALRREGELNE